MDVTKPYEFIWFVSDPGYLALDQARGIFPFYIARIPKVAITEVILNPTFKYLRNSAAVGGREQKLLATLSPNVHGS